MNTPENDSPFEEKKSARLVWIVPSIILHLIILIAWLMLPEELPREPVDRKLTINSQQAEQLQQHVEDANLVILQAQVSELQAIKQAMAQIRESKMTQLKSFEEEMVVLAPKDSVELFTRFLEAQAQIMSAYQQMFDLTGIYVDKSQAAKALLDAVKIQEAHPLLVELLALRSDIKAQMHVVDSETAQVFALISTADIKLEWIRDPSMVRPFETLKAAVEVAQQQNGKVSRAQDKSFSSRSTDTLKKVITHHEQYAEAIAKLNEGNDPKGYLKNKVNYIYSMFNTASSVGPGVESIADAMQAQVAVTQAAKEMLAVLTQQDVLVGEVQP